MTPGARRPDELFAAAEGGDRAAKARLLSLVERGGEGARDVGRLSAPRAGNAYTIGLTGAPGAGKSTLTSALIAHLRGLGEQVAVLAIERMNTPGSVAWSCMRTRSPRMAPPVNGDDGSTANTATSSPSDRRCVISADVSVLFPAPGAPVRPIV